jgi:hypothetical protein
MIEIAVFLLCLAAFILLPILLVVRAAQLLFGPAVKEVQSAVQEVRERNWRHADAVQREHMVRKAVGWRVIGRVASAGVLAVGAVTFASLPLVPICLLAGYRLLKPIRQEMRDACAYRSTGARDEPRHSSGDVDALLPLNVQGGTSPLFHPPLPFFEMPVAHPRGSLPVSP